MDWAEELKMSIRKTTARKGRRSKSRDVLKEDTPAAATAASGNKELSIDITLDMGASSTTATPPTSTGTAQSSDTKRPPLRRISGGWADGGGLKSAVFKNRSTSGSFDDERFQYSKPKSTPPDDEIPVIPDLEDIKDEVLLNEIVEPPSVSVNRVFTLKELNSDLLAQNAFSAIEDVDLSILTRCLQSQETLDEADDIWEWEKLFTDVIAEIHSDKPSPTVQKIEIGPDELTPTMYA